VICRYFQVPSM